MKNIGLTLTFLAISIISFGQWRHNQSENKFEGFIYKSALVTGVGEFPYNDPLFIIRNSDSYGIEIMISSINYCPDDGHIKIYVDDGEVMTFWYSTSTDKQTVFLLGEDKKSELIVQLKEGSNLYTRIYTGHGSHSYNFTLSGSTSAINSTIGNYLENYKQTKRDTEREEQMIIERKKKEEAEKKAAKEAWITEELALRQEEERQRVIKEKAEKEEREAQDEALRLDKLNNPEKYAEIERVKKQKEEELRIQKLKTDEAKAKADKKAARKEKRNKGTAMSGGLWVVLGLVIILALVVPSS